MASSSSSPSSQRSNSHRFTVGYALTSKKTKSFMQPKLESYARNKGITFVPINHNKPLEEQGPFDAILHKIYGRDWREALEVFSKRHPDVIVLDPPEAIQHLRSRQSMLQGVANLNLCHQYGKVGIPKQLVVTGGSLSAPELVTRAGLKLPLDGTANSHALSIAYDVPCLSQLDPPFVVQEFIKHGGLLFKVYVMGDSLNVVRRPSLADICVGNSGAHGLIPFPRVSSASAPAEESYLDPQTAELPPQQLLDSLARELRQRLGLSLFNMDIIRAREKLNNYYVIDINYFPGYGKMPDYEIFFTEFLLRLSKKC
ncbi:hypothetical protein O6H91_05G054200 [Diphasiastrum complanatum]|uniref:Uncharacterized protein n=1 Tax=Diphasiastrum complanatum TaxID=34168 RepID=A0ACC2DNB9_DIPCM|nr:hypothetical protein O6H91_05G054200 [Diphasiastrum complanatum]